MIKVQDKKECCGCSACANICPKKCVKMIEDEEGFLYPNVDETKCIECKLCIQACPIIHSEKDDSSFSQKGYIVQHINDSIRRESTSGGAFTAIATWIIRQGGIVFGAGFRNGTFIVEHQAVDNENELSLFRNSKYVKSSIGDVYQKVKEFLLLGRWVCFSGTPCQVEGLRCFLRQREYEKLICVDFVCRGVPSPRIFQLYLDYQSHETGGEFTKVLFRDKFYGYHYSSFSIYNKKESLDYHKGVDTNPYLRAFFNNLSDRPSCYSCRFKKRYRKSDLTLWDCFNIEKFSKKMDGKGTTRVLVHSEKGDKLIQSVKMDLRIEQINPDKLTEGVREMFHSVPINPKRKDFFMESHSMLPADFFHKWFPITLKVRINALVRLMCHKLGVYSFVKRCFMLIYVRRDERKSNFK